MLLMKKLPLFVLSCTFLTLLSACSNGKNQDAINYLNNIEQLYKSGQYDKALSQIDSIQLLYPKAYDEIKAGLALKQKVRIAFNEKQIQDSDSLLLIYNSKIDSIKALFAYQKDIEDSQGTFIPKSVFTSSVGTTMLRPGVNEDGEMYIESIYVGGQSHNKISAVTKDKKTAESLPINADGLNYKFSNLGQQYEVIRVIPSYDNGLAEFIYRNSEQPLTIQLKGKNVLSYTLSNAQKKAVADSYLLSAWINKRDSLIINKNKAKTLIEYVESKNDSIATATNK